MLVILHPNIQVKPPHEDTKTTLSAPLYHLPLLQVQMATVHFVPEPIAPLPELLALQDQENHFHSTSENLSKLRPHTPCSRQPPTVRSLAVTAFLPPFLPTSWSRATSLSTLLARNGADRCLYLILHLNLHNPKINIY